MRQGLEPPWGGLHLSISDHRRGGSRPVVDRALIDGEPVVRQVDGRSDFEALMTKRGGAQASLVACRRLMTIPVVGQPTALAFVAAIDDPRASADREMSAPIWAWFPTASVGRGRLRQRHLEMRDRRMRTLLYEAANVMLTRYKGQLQTQGLGVWLKNANLPHIINKLGDALFPKKPMGDTRGTFLIARSA
jgi:hypothetical protein